VTADRANERGGSSAATAEAAPVKVGAAGPATGIADDPAVDEAVIEQLATITDSQGFSVLGELLNAFLTATPVRLDALDQALACRDLSVVADQAHALTGSSASFGARGMAALCRRLRAAAEHDDHDEARLVMRHLHAEFLRVRARLVTLTRRGA
jgi:HPt (histidine-containing phosphotransfer) domain-containing protein